MIHKEQLLYFFCTNTKLRTSQFDKKFFMNIQDIISRTHSLTSGQAKLFDHLIVKYKKQLLKSTELAGVDISNLVWKTKIVNTDPEMKRARVSVIDDGATLQLVVPFNKQFITDFRKVEDNRFVWNKQEYHYTAPFSTYSLKILYTLLPKYFDNGINYCDELSELFSSSIAPYQSATIWDPTLTKVNGRLYVLGVSEQLGELIQSMDIAENDIKTFSNMINLGINIDKKLIGDDPKNKFASEIHTEIDIVNIEEVTDWLAELKSTVVFFSNATRMFNTIKTSLENKFHEKNIDVLNIDDDKYDPTKIPKGSIHLYPAGRYNNINMPIYQNISKYVGVKNSTPVNTR
jgi:hypothetical protein